MNTQREHSARSEERGISSVSVLFGRLMWFMIGPAILVGTVYGIVTRGGGWVSAASVTYVITVALMVVGRWKEQSSGCATLADGKPATWEQFHRYVRYLLPVALVVWFAANILGNHILNPGS